MIKMTKFEIDVADMITSGDILFLKYLHSQLCSTFLIKREISPNGFLLKYQVNSLEKQLPGMESFVYGDLSANIEGLEFGAGFICFVKNGLIDAIEGFSYQEKWPKWPFKYELYYDLENNKRNVVKTIQYSEYSTVLEDNFCRPA